MFQTTVIASGSKGNCVLIRTELTTLLLDAGISAKRIFATMDALKIDKSTLAGVILSHEHSDHCRSVGAISRIMKVPLYLTADTHMQASHKLGNLQERARFFKAGHTFEVGDIVIHPFQSSHDAIDSCNFSFVKKDLTVAKLGVATDLGYPSKLSLMHLADSTTLVLESNHDERMLMEGPYEWFLKQRIKSIQGHLSNDQAVGVISQVLHPGLKNLILAHLSEINNTPEKAENNMRSYLREVRSEVRLLIADPNRHTPLLDI